MHLGFGGFGVAVNKVMHRVSIECLKQGCPWVFETRDLDPKGKLSFCLSETFLVFSI